MFKTYELHKLVKGYDEFGSVKESYELVGSIEVQTSINTVTTAQGNVVYNAFEIVAVTPFKDFELKENYKLINEEHEYKVEHITPSRLTILRLKEIIQ